MLDTREYIIFVLGYDELIRSKFKEHNQQECDLAYNICEKIADDFMESAYNDSCGSVYDNLVEFINDLDVDSCFTKYETAVKLHIYFKGQLKFDEAYNRLYEIFGTETPFQMYEAEIQEV